MRFIDRYQNDRRAKIAALFIIIVGLLIIWSEPSFWPYVVGFWITVFLIAYFKRNSP